MTKRVLTLAAMAALLFGAGCKPKVKEISSLQRREAESLVSEAKFALSVRDIARAEATLARATAICPDVGDYWLELGRCRVKLNNRGPAKDAYKMALAVYEADAKRDVSIRGPSLLRQIYVLALLGRADDARAVLTKARKELPGNVELRSFAEGRQLEQMLESPLFKEVAL
jgi:tetratricopeptide (TPR) repeat protein